MDQNELDTILREHTMWLENPETGKQADFNEVDAHGLCFAGADLTKTVIRKSNMVGADFKGALLRDVYIKDSNFKYASMQGCEWCKVRVTASNMSGIEISGSTFVDVTFNTVCFNYADITYTMLGDTMFRHCLFDKADFRNSNLLHISGELNKFDDSKLDGAVIPTVDCFNWKVYAGGVPPIYNHKYQADMKGAILMSYEEYNKPERLLLRGLCDMISSDDVKYAVELLQSLKVQ